MPRGVFIVGCSRTLVYASPSRVIRIGVDYSPRAVQHAGARGIVGVHGWDVGAVEDTLPSLVGGVVIWFCGTDLDALIGGVVCECLHLSDRACFNAVPCVVVGIAIVWAEQHASLGRVFSVVRGNVRTFCNTYSGNWVCEVLAGSARACVLASLSYRVSVKVRHYRADVDALTSRIEAKQASRAVCCNDAKPLSIISIEGIERALINANAIGCVSIHEGIYRAVLDACLGGIVRKVVDGALGYAVSVD